jgi:CubicO group peptidase (beta-lactamase class C family)
MVISHLGHPPTGFSRLPETRALLDQWVDEGECLGGQLFVWHDGQVVADMAVGRSGPSRMASPRDVGRLYCAVKPITACCLARAVAAGEASFDDPASRFLPDLSFGPRRTITLRQLLSHTSGLPNFPLSEPYDYCFADLVKTACTQRVAPERWYRQPTYNNTHAWHILGAVIERIYGAQFADVVTRVISMPAGLPGLRMILPDPARYVRCYQARPGFPVLPEPAEDILFRQVNPAHGGFATVRDLGLFYSQLIRSSVGDGTLLNEAAMREITQENSVIDLYPSFENRTYGLGFFTNVRNHATGGKWSYNSFGHPGQIGRHRVIHGFGDMTHRVAVAIRIFSVGAKNNWRFHKLGAVIWSDLDLGPTEAGVTNQ